MSKILIVDDSDDLLDVMKFFLQEKGYHVKTLNTAKDISSHIRTFSPDLLILDIFLSGEDGRNVCKELRAQQETRYLCILFFSATPKVLENYKEYGADGYIEKPFGLNKIVEK